ncbi:MAG TPA: glycosyltransferase family 1 protein [Pyrinomonadaceae bacterium]|jgi:glycosyltransferase involved in cell wall biosynthesis
MRIGIDGIPLAEIKTGVGHYTFELAQSLALAAPSDEFELISPHPFVESEAAGAGPKLPGNLRLVRAKTSSLGRHWWMIGLPLYLKRAGLTLFHGTNYNVPLWKRCPTVLTIHDLSSFLHPETHEAHLVRRARRRLPIMARTATKIITPSESVRREVCETLPVRAAKVQAIPEAPRRFFRPVERAATLGTLRRLGIEGDFILFVGTIEPRKNLLTLARAFDKILRTTSLCPQLVIAGKEGWLTGELFSYLKESDAAGRVRFTGYVAEDDLRALYSACGVFVYPSLYEGFGLPPLEAMACGAPVITSRIPHLMETTGSAAHLVNPTDAGEMARSIIRLLTDEAERRRLSSAGLSRAAEFSWEGTARATIEVYRQALGEGD